MQVFSNKLSSFPSLDSKSVHIRKTIPKSQIQKLKWCYFLLLLTLVLTYKYQIRRSSPIILSFFLSLTHGRLKLLFFYYEKVTLFGFFYAIFLFFLVFLNLRIELHRFTLKIYCLNS